MTDLPPEEQVVPAMLTCPGCGVPVAVGYPKCPRCHAVVPQPPRPKRATFREEMIAGGTSLEPPGEPTRSWPYLVAAALVIAGLVVWVAGREADKESIVPEDPYVTADGDDEDDSEAVDDDDDEDEDDSAAKPAGGGTGEPPRPSLGSAIRQLDKALREARLWSKVSADGDVVVVESAQCSDVAIGTVITEHAGDLGAAGATALRCQEPHGAVVFDRGL